MQHFKGNLGTHSLLWHFRLGKKNILTDSVLFIRRLAASATIESCTGEISR